MSSVMINANEFFMQAMGDYCKKFHNAGYVSFRNVGTFISRMNRQRKHFIVYMTFNASRLFNCNFVVLRINPFLQHLLYFAYGIFFLIL